MTMVPFPVASDAFRRSHFAPSTEMVPLPICFMFRLEQGAIVLISSFITEEFSTDVRKFE